MAKRQGVCVIGRTNFSTGIGQVGLAALELFGRSSDVSLFATDVIPGERTGTLRTPFGGEVDLVNSTAGFDTCFFADVLWNGAQDLNYQALPDKAFKIAHIAFDSNELPPEWVRIANLHIDLLLVMTPSMEDVAIRSGVRVPVGTLPVALDIDTELDRPRRRCVRSTVRIGTISAFHERKNLEALVEGFALAFDARQDVELVIHSNLSIGPTFESVKSLIEDLGEQRIRLSTRDLSVSDKFRLISGFDIYVNVAAGEGYSIGPREAMAQGRPVVLSDIPGHRELVGPPGVVAVPTRGWLPARYPEIDNRQFGFQSRITPADIAGGLQAALEYVRHEECPRDESLRRARAARYSMTALEPDYLSLVEPYCTRRMTLLCDPTTTHLPPQMLTSARLTKQSRKRAPVRRKLVIQAHDAGFFSLFNVFMSYLAWSLQEPIPPLVVPDWDVTRLLERSGGGLLESYCYSTPRDGNMWLCLFEPISGLSSEEMNDVDTLYANGTVPRAVYNEDREPLLTYVNAYDLYRAPWFAYFRRQYNSALNEHVKLRSEFQGEIDRMRSKLRETFVIAVHVKHPSHAIEQPDQKIAMQAQYFSAIRQVIRSKGMSEHADDWRIFLATDQDRVVKTFLEEFGDRMVSFSDVERVDLQTDERYDELDEASRLSIGHQLQHQLAKRPGSWSPRFAWEVWRDAEAMAASDVLLHSVSNVATAASYMNPQVEMVFCSPA